MATITPSHEQDVRQLTYAGTGGCNLRIERLDRRGVVEPIRGVKGAGPVTGHSPMRVRRWE